MIDVAQVRTDLDIPPVSGVDSREDKLELILGLITQGLDLVPSSIHPLDGTAFNEWGWDIADIDQVLYLPDYEISILMGNFARNEIRERLSEKGYTQHLMGDFSLFASETKRLQFALKSDTLIVSASEDNDAITTIIQYVEAERPALNTSESLESIFKQFDGAWGVVLAPRADFVGFWEQYDALNPASYKERLPKIDALYQQESNELSSSQLVGWDFMAISFYAVEKESVLNFIYHYPSEKEAAASLELVEKTLTETPSFRSPGQVWGKFMSLEGIKVDAQLVIAQTRTPSRSLLGSAFKSRDHWAFVPFLIEE